MTSTQIIIVLIALAGCAYDLRTRRIPNAITFGAALLAFVHAFATSGGSGLGLSIAGWAIGCALFLPLFIVRGLGAGDVKFLAALGAWFGPADLFTVIYYTAIAGGVMALVVVLRSGYLKSALANVWLLLCHWRITGFTAHAEISLDNPRAPRLPYGIAIAAGALTTIWRQ